MFFEVCSMQNILKSVQFEIRNQKSLMNAYHFAIRIRLFFIFFLESKISDDQKMNSRIDVKIQKYLNKRAIF